MVLSAFSAWSALRIAPKRHCDEQTTPEVVCPNTVDFTPEMEELAGQYTDIVSKYHLAMSQPVTCEFDGVTYASNGELPEENREEIIRLLCEAREEMIAPVYVDLINNRNEFARMLGYDNFLEYSYAQEFNRDYTAEDVKAMLDNVYERHFI